MSLALRYGDAKELMIPLERERLLGLCGSAFVEQEASLAESFAAGGLNAESFAETLQQALLHPLEFPGLSQAVVEGDKATIAVEPFVPHVVEVVTALAEQLIAGGVAADDITVLERGREIADDAIRVSVPIEAVASTIPEMSSRLPSGSAAGLSRVTRTIRVERHDPLDRGKLGFLANTRSGRPVYLNRLLTDSDFVVPVGCFRGREAWAYRGIFGILYPTFSDKEAQTRYRNAHLLQNEEEAFAKSQQEIEMVGWQSGTQFTVQIVPGPGDAASAVVAGETRAVARRSTQIWNALWQAKLPGQADLVVAALNGARAQTWEHLGRALAAALEVVDEGGAIALCTELSEPLGPAMELFSKTDDRDTAVAEIRKVRPPDAFPALILDRAQRRVRVYLLSNLDTSTVEDLGMAPVGESADIGRLAARRKSCIVLSDAQYAAPTLA